MIGRIHGVLLETLCASGQILVDVQGVGYELEVPLCTMEQLPAPGQSVMLHTHLIIREEAHTLYGFHAKTERAFFRELLRISGVGPKLALALLSGMEPERLCNAIRQNNISTLTQISGVGKKTAERLVVELKDRLDRIFPVADSSGAAISSAIQTSLPLQEAQEALIALGYKPADALRTLRDLHSDSTDVPTLIRQALRRMIASSS